MKWVIPFLQRPLRVPYVAQMEAVECGAACLAMVLAHHGHHVPLSEVRETCAVSRDGVNALAILRAAENYGLNAKAYRAELKGLEQVALPAILHWNFSHFVVLERLARDGGARVVDPAQGRIGWQALEGQVGDFIAVVYQGNLWLVDSGSGVSYQVTGDGLVTRIDWK